MTTHSRTWCSLDNRSRSICCAAPRVRYNGKPYGLNWRVYGRHSQDDYISALRLILACMVSPRGFRGGFRDSGDTLLISAGEFRGNSGDILLIQRSSRHGSAVRVGMAGGGEAVRKDEIARLANGLDESFSASLRLRARNNPFRHKDGQCPAVNL